MDPFVSLARALEQQQVRYVVIGVWGANYYALTPGVAFRTEDRDLFLPPDPDNLLRCWASCEATGLALWSGSEPLDSPRDRWLADRIVTQRALTRAADQHELHVDLTLSGGLRTFTEWRYATPGA